jgi:hypothetical protein
MGAMPHALRYIAIPNAAEGLVYENPDVSRSSTSPHPGQRCFAEELLGVSYDKTG